jgi:hypothetical protein
MKRREREREVVGGCKKRKVHQLSEIGLRKGVGREVQDGEAKN